MSRPLVLIVRGREVACDDAIFRPALRPLPGREARKDGTEVMASSIVAACPRRWSQAQPAAVRTADGDLPVTVHPHPDGTIRIEGDAIETIAADLRLR